MAACGKGAVEALVVVGASHRSSTLATRDLLFVADEAMSGMLEALREAGCDQALLVNTCDRTEVAALADDPDRDPVALAPRIMAVLARHAGLAVAEISAELYTLYGDEAVSHLFRVTASVDSLVIGEPHVLGQIKASHQASQRAGMSGRELEAVLQAAYGVAKRVRSETGVARRTVSIASAAAEIAQSVHGELSRCSGLLLGTGELGELIAGSLVAKGLGNLVIIHPQETRAEILARVLGCHVGNYQALAECLVHADIVVTALGSRHMVLTAAMMRATLSQRRQKPVFLVDAALPGDVEPAVDDLDGVFRYTLGDLEDIAMEGRAYRETELHAALQIIDEGVSAFVHDQAGRAAGPLLASLHGHFEAVREQALRDAGGDAEKATQLLINRLLHRPSATLRMLATKTGPHRHEFDAAERALQRLFGIGPGKAEDEK